MGIPSHNEKVTNKYRYRKCTGTWDTPCKILKRVVNRVTNPVVPMILISNTLNNL